MPLARQVKDPTSRTRERASASGARIRRARGGAAEGPFKRGLRNGV
jgi:hypothetical protein